MPHLSTIEALKTESLTAIMHYPIRANFSSTMQLLIDAITLELNRIIRSQQLTGHVEANVDDDGDLSFQYTSSEFHFRLECSSTAMAVQFLNLYRHSLALEIIKTYFSNAVSLLNISVLNSFSIDFQNVFNLANNSTNHEVFRQALMPSLSDSLSAFTIPQDELGRIDFKVSWFHSKRHMCAYKLECPGNDKHSTLWTGLTLKSREDIEVKTDESTIRNDVETAYELYLGPYCQHLVAALEGFDIDLSRRQLEQS